MKFFNCPHCWEVRCSCPKEKDTSTSYAKKEAEKPEDKIKDLENTVKELKNTIKQQKYDIRVLEEKVEAEKASYSLIYDVKEQLRKEVADLNNKLESEYVKAQSLV